MDQYVSPETGKEIRRECIVPADAGILSSDKLFERIGARFNMPPEQVRKEWTDAATIDSRVVEIITRVKKNHRTALCTNAFADFLRPILVAHDLEKLFDTIVISSEIGFAKPAPEIFETTLKKLEVSAQQTIFTDDSKFNIAAANALGLTAVPYISPEQLSDDLAHLGVLAR